MSEDFSSWGEGEIVVKTKSDLWVLGKLSNHRHLYVVLTRKNAELIEICGKFVFGNDYLFQFLTCLYFQTDEVRRLRNVIFKDILLLE